MTDSTIKVAFLMADYGHDPTETSIPYKVFAEAGFSISFVTESGKRPACDKRMLSGWTQKILGADAAAIAAYDAMAGRPEWQNPLAWTTQGFSLADFDLVFLPGGHDKAVRQILDSERVHALLADYFPRTRRPGGKCCAAICHGVQVLAHTRTAAGADGKSVLHDVVTTALPGTFESVAYQGTRMFLGDYYKTYGAGTENVEDVVKKTLDDASVQWKVSTSMGSPFVVQDETYNYLSGRFPGDAEMLAKKTVEVVKAAGFSI